MTDNPLPPGSGSRTPDHEIVGYEGGAYAPFSGNVRAICSCGWRSVPCDSRQRAAFCGRSHRGGKANAAARARRKELGRG